MERFDYILAGGGAAGLGLAYHMVKSELSHKRILIIDLAKKDRNDRTWCYWTPQSDLLDDVVAKRWTHMWFHGAGRSHRWALLPYEYRMIRGIDFYRHVHTTLEAFSNVTIINTRVASIQDGGPDTGSIATVTTEDGRVFGGDFVFDSLFLARDFNVDEQRFLFLKQHFVGWFIETDEDVFDPDAATLFDFRVAQQGVFRFMYILPETPRRALLEFTLFSGSLLERSEYEEAISSYVEQWIPGVRYQIIETEDGIIPMTDQPFVRKAGNRIMNIGTKGGRVKTSTGFAFHRMQRDAERIVESLRRHGHPFHGHDAPGRYAMFDAMLLSLLNRRGQFVAESVFPRLFERNPLPRLWRFLDEDGGIGENIALMATVPWFPFIAAWFRVVWRRIRGGRRS